MQHLAHAFSNIPLELLYSKQHLSKVNSFDEIIGVKTFLTLFIFKKNGSKLVDFIENQHVTSPNHDVNRQLVMNWLKTNPISIGAATFHTQYLTSTFNYFNVSIQASEFSPLSNSSNTIYNIYPSFDVCLDRNYFLERYDAVLMEPYAFSFFVRFYNRNNGFGSVKKMESGNFVPIPLIPYEVYTNRMVVYRE